MPRLGESGVFIVAELSANHNGRLDLALATVRAAKEAGADAIKLQTFRPDTITVDADQSDFRVDHGTLWDGRTLFELYRESCLPWEWHEPIFKLAKDIGLVCFSSPFDVSAVDFLEGLDCPVFKIASPEITDIPLIKRVAKSGKPVILSSGVAELADIDMALRACRSSGNEDLYLLKCTSSYPTDFEDCNLASIPSLRTVFDVHVGLSDHSPGWVAPVVAVSLGAVIVEKHFIIDRKLGGLDSSFSLNQEEFSAMVGAIRDAEKSLGSPVPFLTESARTSRRFCRSLYVVEDVSAGEVVSGLNVRSVRPGNGLHPSHWEGVQGRRFAFDLKRGTALSHELLAPRMDSD